MPVVELTMEQEFKLRQIEDGLKGASKEDIITVFLALQHQCFVLGNNIKQLINEWPIHPPTTPEVPWKRGTLYETKD
jgi:hypothetical protein